MKQLSTESVDQFLARLRQQASRCQFEDMDQNLLDQVIANCHNPKVRTKLLEVGNGLTLPKALDFARTVETVAVQEREMIGRTPATPFPFTPHLKKTRIKSIPKKTSGRSKLHIRRTGASCYRCGKEGHLANDPSCPARNTTCQRCNLRENFASKCRTKLYLRLRTKSTTGESALADNDDPSDQECIFRDPTTARTTVWMGGVQTDAVVDSSASSNILSQEQWHQLQKEGIKYTPHEVHKQLFPYGSSKPLSIVESFQTEAKTATSSVTAGCIVVQIKGPI